VPVASARSSLAHDEVLLVPVQGVVVARLTYAIDRERFEPDGWQARANGPD